MKPWREVITPHPDVASGNYRQAEFAADLSKRNLGGPLRRTNQTGKAKFKEYDETINLRIPETYRWFLNPEQLDPQQPYHFEAYQLSGNDPLIMRVVCKKE